MEDAHYVCKGTCGGVADEPKTCSAEGCSHEGKHLEQCNCENKDSHKSE